MDPLWYFYKRLHLFCIFFGTFQKKQKLCSTGLETGCKPVLLHHVSKILQVKVRFENFSSLLSVWILIMAGLHNLKIKGSQFVMCKLDLLNYSFTSKVFPSYLSWLKFACLIYSSKDGYWPVSWSVSRDEHFQNPSFLNNNPSPF